MRKGIIAAAFAVAGCLGNGGSSESGVAGQWLGSTTYHLKNVNVAELRSIDIEAQQSIDAGNLVVALCVRHNSVFNTALGIDHFFSNANSISHPVLSANEAGWWFNFGGTEADGFGDFPSRKSANPGGRGGVSCAQPLVFTHRGDPTLGANTPLEVAVHLRFDGDCSGWVSNRIHPGWLESDPGCKRKPPCGLPCP